MTKKNLEKLERKLKRKAAMPAPKIERSIKQRLVAKAKKHKLKSTEE